MSDIFSLWIFLLFYFLLFMHIFWKKHTGWICKSAARINSGVTNLAIWVYVSAIKYSAVFRKLTALGLSRSWNFWRIPTFENWPHIKHHRFTWLIDGFRPDRGVFMDLWNKSKKNIAGKGVSRNLQEKG